MINRKIYNDFRAVLAEMKIQPFLLCVAGPGKSGKTNLVQFFLQQVTYRDLTHPFLRGEFEYDPIGFFASFKVDAGSGMLVILDNVHHVKGFRNIMETLGPLPGGVVIITSDKCVIPTGCRVFTLPPLSLLERRTSRGFPHSWEHAVFQGGLPSLYENPGNRKAFLRHIDSVILELIERYRIQEERAFRICMRICAEWIGRRVNLTDMAKRIGVSRNTVASWLRILDDNFFVFLLPPFSQGSEGSPYRRRLLKSPRVQFWDGGLASALLGIADSGQLMQHEKSFQLFENFVIMEYCKNCCTGDGLPGLYYWRDNQGYEISLIIKPQGERAPLSVCVLPDFEIQRVNAPDLNWWKQFSPGLALYVVLRCDEVPASLSYGRCFPWHQPVPLTFSSWLKGLGC